MAAREHSKTALRGTKAACSLLSCRLGAPGEPPPRFLRAIGSGRRAWVGLLIPQHHRLWEQLLETREAEKPVVSAGFPGRDRCVMKKHQQNQNKTKKTKAINVKYKMLYVSTAVLDLLRKSVFLLDTCIYLDTC